MANIPTLNQGTYYDPTTNSTNSSGSNIKFGTITADHIFTEDLSANYLWVNDVDINTLTVSSLDPSKLVATDSSSNLISRNLIGTTNRVIVDTSGSTTTLSTPQDIATTSNPTFNGMKLTGLVQTFPDFTRKVVTIDATNNLTTTLATSTGSNRTIVMLDASANLLANVINGSRFSASDLTDQLKLGGGVYSTTINAPFPAADRIVTIPDVGTNSSFVMTEGNQTITAVKSFDTIIVRGGGAGIPATMNSEGITTSGAFGISAANGASISGGSSTLGLYGNAGITLQSNSGAITLIGTSVNPSLPLQIDSSNRVYSGQIALTTANLSGTLPIGLGGTNSSTALTNGKLMRSVAGAIVEGTSSTDPSFNTITTSSTITAGGNITGANLSGTNTGNITITTPAASSNANAMVLTGQQLQLAPADATNPGILTTGTQSIAGSKTFTDQMLSIGTGSSDCIFNMVNNAGTFKWWTGGTAPPDLMTLSNAGQLKTLSYMQSTIGIHTNTTNQLLLGTTRTVTLNAPTPATASRVHTVPDVGANSNFIMSESAQTINGVKTFSSAITASVGVKSGCYMRRSNSAGITLITSGDTTITFNTLIASSGITYSAGVYTLPVIGMYMISWTADLTAKPTIEISMLLKCSQDMTINGGINNFNALSTYSTTNTLIYTTAVNQTVTPTIYKSAAGPNLGSNPGYNFITIQLINAL